jgi:hypothetical protein
MTASSAVYVNVEAMLRTSVLELFESIFDSNFDSL